MYIIFGTYRGRKEQIDQTDDLDDAIYLVSEYQLAYGTEWNVTYEKGDGYEKIHRTNGEHVHGQRRLS
jgi:hypothetical protein